jgi:hypothetical protein
MPPSFARTLIVAGLLLAGLGLLMLAKPHLPWLGRLPGDFHIRREGFSFYFPFTTCLLLSVLLSLILSLFRR